MEERDYQFVEHENPYTYRDGDLTVCLLYTSPSPRD